MLKAIRVQDYDVAHALNDLQNAAAQRRLKTNVASDECGNIEAITFEAEP